jgi:propanol-preferring alcohol dehydrogenase
MGLDAIIDTTPAWFPVVEALANLKPRGRLVINAIRKEDADKDALLEVRYETHLWQEKRIQSVANVTASDIAEFLPLAAAVPLRPEIEIYRFEDANRALRDLRFAPIRGAKVLTFGDAPG